MTATEALTRVVIGADHNGTALAAHLAAWLRTLGHDVAVDLERSGDLVDYPLVCARVCAEVASGRRDWALVVGGSGQGEVIASNKVRGIRAGLCHTALGTTISRAHNDANVMVVGAKVVSDRLAERLVRIWLTTAFKGGVHLQRLEQIAALEESAPA